MAHFSVLVISRTADGVADALAPFALRFLNDGRKGNFLVFEDETDRYRHRYETGSVMRLRGRDGSLCDPFDRRFQIEGRLNEFHYQDNPAGYEKIEIPLRDLFRTFDAYAASLGLERDEGGRYGLWHNPNWKWDYWRYGQYDDDDENSASLQCRIADVDPEETLRDWGWGFYAVVTADGQWATSDEGETDVAWTVRCLAFIRAAPPDYWFSAIMCHG